MADTVRFSKVVEASGEPEPYTLWQTPNQDRTFRSALKEHRVMTIHRNEAAKTDFGEVGYVPGPMHEFLVFPKSLIRFESKRVIGIKFELLKERPVPANQRIDTTKPRKQSNVRKVQKEALRTPKIIQPPSHETASSSARGADEELKIIKGEVRKALKALSEDQHVTVYRILSEALNR